MNKPGVSHSVGGQAFAKPRPKWAPGCGPGNIVNRRSPIEYSRETPQMSELEDWIDVQISKTVWALLIALAVLCIGMATIL
jgi:hypothetical protein